MIKLKFVFVSIISLLVLTIVNIEAQTKNEAILAFNEGVGLMKTDVSKAILAFEKSVAISEQVGDSANDIKSKAIQEIPGLYYQKAKSFAMEKKWPETIAAGKDALKVSEKYNNIKIKDASQKLLVQSYVVVGGNYYKNKDDVNAIKAFDSAIYINPNYTKAYYNKALVYNKMENTPEFLEQSNLVIEKAKAENDTNTVNQMTKSIGEYYAKIGIKNMKANQNSEAVNNFNSAFKYNYVTKDMYYYLALVYNKQNKYDEALTNANKGLEMETGTPEAKAKYYFELATAQAGKKDNDNACANYKKANYGQFVTAVKAQLTNLKCK